MEGEESSIVFRKEVPQATYMSGLTKCVEELVSGRWLSRSWTVGGGLWRPLSILEFEQMPPSFHLVVDGQTLDFGWEVSEMKEVEPGHAVICLRSTIRPVDVDVNTLLDGTGFIARWLTIKNRSNNPAAINDVAPLSGLIMAIEPLEIGAAGRLRSWRDRTDKDNPFTLGYFADQIWDLEGSFVWQPIPKTPLRIEARRGKSGHGNPFFIVRNEATGEHVVGGIEWSGNWSVEFIFEDRGVEIREGYMREDYDGTRSYVRDAKKDEVARLWLKAGPENPYWVGGPLRVMAPGETVETPKMHVGLFAKDFDGSVQAWHRHLRKSVICEPCTTVTSGIGIITDETTMEVLKARLDRAADAGAEVATIDAGWYGAKGTHWFPTVGDYDDDSKRLLGGLKPFFDYTRQKGLKCGLWLDIERIGLDSEAYKRHREWWMRRYGRETDTIDITNPEAAKWLEEQLTNVIERYKLDLFRLDYNVYFAQGQVPRYGYMENSNWRYYEVLYGIYDQIKRKFPNLIMENCASGGGRTDIGIMKRFHFTWVSDEHQPPRCTRALNGMSIALPPERVDAVAMGRDVDFVMRHNLLSHMAVTGLPLDHPQSMRRVRHYVELYKGFVRPWLPECLVYHHTPVLKGEPGEPKGWCVLEYISEDRSKALVSLFRLADTEPEYHLCLRGVDRGRTYRVTFDNTAQIAEIAGERLVNEGITVRLERDLSSELLILEGT